MAHDRCPIRPARPEDAGALIGMMRALAAFEGDLRPAPTWLVLPTNDGAKRLYRRFGGTPDPDWEHRRLIVRKPNLR